MAMLKVLQNCNQTLALLNLQNNAGISPVLLEALVSRRVLNSFLKHLSSPLEENVVPLAIQAAIHGGIVHEESKLTHFHNLTGKAGFVFHLVTAVASKDSYVIKSR
jgi:hypothetical protein